MRILLRLQNGARSIVFDFKDICSSPNSYSAIFVFLEMNISLASGARAMVSPMSSRIYYILLIYYY